LIVTRPDAVLAGPGDCDAWATAADAALAVICADV
jgi:hypothetical protein